MSYSSAPLDSASTHGECTSIPTKTEDSYNLEAITGINQSESVCVLHSEAQGNRFTCELSSNIPGRVPSAPNVNVFSDMESCIKCCDYKNGNQMGSMFGGTCKSPTNKLCIVKKK